MGDVAKRAVGGTKAGARALADPGTVAYSEAKDAVSCGLVRDAEQEAESVLAGKPARAKASRALSYVIGHGEEHADAGDDAGTNMGRLAGVATQRHRNVRTKMAALAAEEADESDELSGTRAAYETTQDVRAAAARIRERKPDGYGEPGTADVRKGAANSGPGKTVSAQAKDAPEKAGTAPKGKARKPAAAKTENAAKERIQRRAGWAKSRAIRAEAETAKAATTAAKSGGAKAAIAAAASSAMPVLGGILAAVIGFILVVLMVSQLASALFGFWENEASKEALKGLPPYITSEMVTTALECQEKYGHPAGCTIAQIICESGMGDHMSGLAERDKNLFGIKWASSFSLCPEVSGYSSYSTQEEYDGETVTIVANFTSFNSYEDCIVFRSRVLLQNSRYADNELIKQAIAECDSDKMAEGLKDAGYATSSSYVDSLKSIMRTYNLYRFDGMTVEQYQQGAERGETIVKAAYSQLGVPYVWGGSSPYVGLDCSGLTQWCYAQAGISIAHYTETQYEQGTAIPLSQAAPGDILYRYGHVAIYIGGDQYIHAPQPGDVVSIAIGIDYFTCALRF